MNFDPRKKGLYPLMAYNYASKCMISRGVLLFQGDQTPSIFLFPYQSDADGSLAELMTASLRY